MMVYLELVNGVGVSSAFRNRLNKEGPIFGPVVKIVCEVGSIRLEFSDDVGVLHLRNKGVYYDGDWFGVYKIWDDKNLRRHSHMRDRCMPFVQQFAVIPAYAWR